jgi:hypothetical protein
MSASLGNGVCIDLGKEFTSALEKAVVGNTIPFTNLVFRYGFAKAEVESGLKDAVDGGTITLDKATFLSGLVDPQYGNFQSVHDVQKS